MKFKENTAFVTQFTTFEKHLSILLSFSVFLSLFFKENNRSRSIHSNSVSNKQTKLVSSVLINTFIRRKDSSEEVLEIEIVPMSENEQAADDTLSKSTCTLCVVYCECTEQLSLSHAYTFLQRIWFHRYFSCAYFRHSTRRLLHYEILSATCTFYFIVTLLRLV